MGKKKDKGIGFCSVWCIPFFELRCVLLQKKKADGKKHICILIPQDSFIFIDPIRPIAVWLKQCNCFMTLLFCGKNVEKEYIARYPQKFAELKDCFDNIIIHPDFSHKSRYQQKIIDFKFRVIWEYLSFYERIDTFLFSQFHFLDMDFKIRMARRFPGARMVMLFEGTFLFQPVMIWDPNPLYVDYVIFPNRAAYAGKKSKYIKHVVAIRSPKLDPWWRKRSLREVWLNDAINFSSLKHKHIIICAFSRLTAISGTFTEGERDSFRKALLGLMGQFSFIFKFHPAETCSMRDDFTARWIPDGVDWIESELDLLQLTHCGEVFVVVGLTTGIADVILENTPIINFYNNRDNISQRREFESVVEIDGVVEDEYVYRHMIMHANNDVELRNMIYKTVYNQEEKISTKRFEEFLPKEMNSCEIIAKILLQNKYD